MSLYSRAIRFVVRRLAGSAIRELAQEEIGRWEQNKKDRDYRWHLLCCRAEDEYGSLRDGLRRLDPPTVQRYLQGLANLEEAVPPRNQEAGE